MDYLGEGATYDTLRSHYFRSGPFQKHAIIVWDYEAYLLMSISS